MLRSEAHEAQDLNTGSEWGMWWGRSGDDGRSISKPSTVSPSQLAAHRSDFSRNHRSGIGRSLRCRRSIFPDTPPGARCCSFVEAAIAKSRRLSSRPRSATVRCLQNFNQRFRTMRNARRPLFSAIFTVARCRCCDRPLLCGIADEARLYPQCDHGERIDTSTAHEHVAGVRSMASISGWLDRSPHVKPPIPASTTAINTSIATLDLALAIPYSVNHCHPRYGTCLSS